MAENITSDQFTFERNDYNDVIKKTVEQKFNFKNSNAGRQESCPCGKKKGSECNFHYKFDKGVYKCFSENSCGLSKREGNYHDLNNEFNVIKKEEAKDKIPEDKKVKKTKKEDTKPDFIYRNEDGSIAYGIKRYEWLDEKDGKKRKSFNPAIPRPENKWEVVKTTVDNYQLLSDEFKNIKKVLYNSERLKTAKFLWIVEGEKCAIRLQKAFDDFQKDPFNQGAIRYEDGEHIVVTNCHGAGKWRSEYRDQIEKYSNIKEIIILPDNDDAGKRHAKDIWISLKEKAKLVFPNGLEHKEDIYDWLEKGNELYELFYYSTEPAAEVNQYHEFLYIDIPDIQPNKSNENKIYELNEVGSMERFLDLFGSEFIFVEGLGWYHWNKSHWEETKTASIVKNKIIESLYSIREMATNLDDSKYKTAKAFEKMHNSIMVFYNSSMTERKIQSVMKIAENSPRIFRKPDLLNNKHDFLNVKNGVIDLKSGMLLPHNRDYYFTKVIDVDYPRIGKGLPLNAPVWKDFLSSTFLGRSDLIEYMQSMMGYSLSGKTSEQCIFFMTGTGRNGKSTFIKVLQQLLGGYYKKLNTETLMDRHTSSPINNDIARLYDSRLVVCSEVEEGRLWNQSLMKDLSGGDQISARFMRQEYFDFTPNFKLWIYGNYKPVLKGLDEGTKRRFRIIPFDAKIDPKDIKKNLDDQLKKELPQILGWCVEGAVNYYKHLNQGIPIAIPAAVKKANEEYFLDNDPLYLFLEEYFQEGLDEGLFTDSDTVNKKDLYKKYRDWAEETGQKPYAEKSWSRKMKEHGFIDAYKKENGKTNRIYKGVKDIARMFQERRIASEKEVNGDLF